MTREEAIEVLQQDIPCEQDTDLIESLEMAIKALSYDDAKYHEEHEEVIVDKAVWEDAERALQEPCEDAISREDIEECKELMTDINGDIVYAVRMSDIRQVPSVKPQEKTGHCEDCKHFRKLPYHADTLGKCVHHTGFCPKGDWYCADYEPQESEDKE